MQARAAALLKDLALFSEKQPDPRANPENGTFIKRAPWNFFFSTDVNMNVIIDGIGTLPAIKREGKLRLAVLVGESGFLSILPEIKNHVDGVIIVDIDDKVLEHCQFMYNTMLKSENRDKFLDAFLKENPIIKNNWPITVFSAEDRKPIAAPPTIGILAGQIITSADLILREKHFLGTKKDGSRYFACRDSLPKLFFSFVKLDLLNKKEIEKFKDILHKNNAEITIINVTNLFDYTGPFALRDWRKKLAHRSWETSGTLYTSLSTLCSSKKTIILYSRLDPDKQYDSNYLTTCIAASVDSFIAQTQTYVKELLEFHVKSIKNNGNYGRLYKELKVSTQDPDIGEHYRLRKAVHEK